MRRIAALALSAVMLLGASGCAALFDKDVYYEEPYEAQADVTEAEDAADTISNYAALRRAVGRDAIFFLSREQIVKLVSGQVKKEEATAPVADKAPQPQYYVVGGDYFGKEDFERLQQEGFSVTTPVFGAQAGRVEYAPAENVEVDAERTMVTETLAEIYVAQELYQRAIEVYEKLILLNPEKSAYFAVLIEKVKEKTQ